MWSQYESKVNAGWNESVYTVIILLAQIKDFLVITWGQP